MWALFQTDSTFSSALAVSDAAAITAMITFGYATVTYLFAPRKHLTISAIVGYFLVISMVALLVRDTGFISSPFIALWVLAVLFAAPFGIWGYGAVTTGVVAYIFVLSQTNQLTFDAFALSVLFAVVPAAVSTLAWRTGSPTIKSHRKLFHNDEDRSYSELSSRLEAVTDQAHVVISAITDGVISVDGQGTIKLFNPAATKLLGWDVSDALNLHYRSVLKLFDNHHTPILEVNNPIYQALNTNTETNSDMYSLEVNGQNGKKFLADITTTPIGEPGSGAIIVFRDVTRDRAEEREKAEFISTASHEMRTPVASIEGYLGLALNPSTATIDEKAREYIGKAQDAAKHLGRLFKDLLDVSKADDGRLVNNPRVIDVVPFIHDIIVGQTPTAAAKSLTIDFPSDQAGQELIESGTRRISPVFYTIVDPDHLREIIGNLLENAVKYTRAGSVIVDVTGDSTSLTISVKDSGIGIPKEDIPHLFQKFYRVDNADTREIGGTGLGLYLCRKLAEAIDGKLWVESEYQKGSTFYLKLPRTDQDTARNLLDQEKLAALQAAQQAAKSTQHDDSPSLDSLPPVVRPTTPELSQPVPSQPTPAPIEPEPEPQPPILPEAPTPTTPMPAPPTDTATQVSMQPGATITSIPVRQATTISGQSRPTAPPPPASAPVAAPQPPPDTPLAN